jgi:hypothetical protein
MIARQQNVDMQEFHDFSSWISTAATITAGLETAKTRYRIDSVELASDVTVPSSGTNFYAFNLRAGGRSVATFTINGTAITAGLLAAMVMVAESGQSPVDNRVIQPGEVLDLVCTLTGTLTINIRCIVHGRYV